MSSLFFYAAGAGWERQLEKKEERKKEEMSPPYVLGIGRGLTNNAETSTQNKEPFLYIKNLHIVR